MDGKAEVDTVGNRSPRLKLFSDFFGAIPPALPVWADSTDCCVSQHPGSKLTSTGSADSCQTSTSKSCNRAIGLSHGYRKSSPPRPLPARSPVLNRRGELSPTTTPGEAVAASIVVDGCIWFTRVLARYGGSATPTPHERTHRKRHQVSVGERLATTAHAGTLPAARHGSIRLSHHCGGRGLLAERCAKWTLLAADLSA